MGRILSVARLVLVVGTTAAGAARDARAQTASSTAYTTTYGATLGFVVPAGAVSTLHRTGWQLAGFAEWFAPWRRLGYRAALSYARLGGESVTVGTSTLRGTDLGMWSASGDLLWNTQARLFAGTPYLLIGAGLYHTSDKRIAVTPSGSQTESASSTAFGMSVGGGVRWPIGRITPFVEARFLDVFQGTIGDSGSREGAHYFPISFGIRVGS